MRPGSQILFVIKNLKRYLVEESSHNNNILNNVFLQTFLLPAVMKLKTQIKIYQKLVSELGGKFEGAEDFINTRLKELCSEHGISEEELRLCIYLFMLRIQFSLVHSLE